MILTILTLTSMEQFYSVRTYLLIAFIFILLGGFAGFMIQAHKTDNIVTKRIFKGFGLFGLMFVFTRIFYLLSDYEIASNAGASTQVQLILFTSAYPVTYISLAFLFETVERHMLNRKPVLTFLALITGIICFISLVLVVFNVGVDLAMNTGPQEIAIYTLNISGPILIFGISALYIKIIKNASGPVRNRALGAFIGVLILFSGFLLNADNLFPPSFDPSRLVLAPTCFIIGTVTFFYSSSIQIAMTDFYTNKHVCIVHKGEIKGKMFICSKCNAYYCMPCKEAIEQIDKCCWNCKTPFDQSKVADTTKLSEVEPSKEISTPDLVNKGKKEAPGNEPGKNHIKGVAAGQDLGKTTKKNSL
nr:hypothetical protein [Candidatus Sigynarchaeota archaeon]